MTATANSVASEVIPGLVSVIIPSYQRGYIVDRAIASALAQTYGNVEVIVVDDGSTDDTREVVARFADTQFGDKVRYHYQQNAGVSLARNAGLALARGEFVALLDSDDRWLPWKLAAQVAFLKRFPELGMVWTDMAAVDDAQTVLAPAFLRTMYSAYNYVRTEDIFQRSGRIDEIFPQAPAEAAGKSFYYGDIFSPMILGNLVHTSTVLMRRDRQQLVGDFEDIRGGGEDYEFHLNTCSHGPVGFMDVSTVLYRVGAGDQFVTPQGSIFFARSNMRTLNAWLAKAADRIQLPARLLRERIADSHTWLGFEEMKQGRTAVARANLWQSLRLRPAHRRTAALLMFSLLPPVVYRSLRQLKQRRKRQSAAG